MSKAMGAAARVEVLPDMEGTRVIVCSGEFDMETEGALRQALDTAHRDGTTLTVVDLAGVSFADSSMLNTLIGAHNRQPLVLAGPLAQQVIRLLEVTGTDSFFHLAADANSARATSPAVAPR
ncbi:STAS domain-containing protein [Streptomyces agglomeratus]|uniref:STAS domain-containing protein n=1 Tax=Streptomyces agglomeratus TaxID=285458 RepID=UPI00210D6ACD|nr:STAS domain-containing protein [Streptomyces agglomeratus]